MRFREGDCIMRKAMTAIMGAALFPAPAMASDWHFVSRSGVSARYVDRESARRQGDRIVVWEQSVERQATAGGVKSFMARVQYDCVAGWYQTVGMTTYSAGGDVIDGRPFTGNVTYPVPDSVGEHLFRFVCEGMSSGLKVGDPKKDAEDRFRSGR